MFKKININEYMPKVGDIVTVCERNPNHLGVGTTPYAGFSGKITEVFENNSFFIFSGNSTLVVPLNKRERFYVLLDGTEFYVKRKTN